MTEQSNYSKQRKLITNITVPLVALNQNDSKRHNGPRIMAWLPIRKRQNT